MTPPVRGKSKIKDKVKSQKEKKIQSAKRARKRRLLKGVKSGDNDSMTVPLNERVDLEIVKLLKC
jgi:hypothetical protein